MRRTLVLAIGVLCLASVVLARTPEEAAQVASQFFNHSGVAPVQRIQCAAAAITMAKPVDLVYTQNQVDTTTPALYVFNNHASEGFVLVSASDNTRAILGYGDKGCFNPENIPTNMQFWMQMYADEIARVQAVTVVESEASFAEEVSYPEITPILDGVEWNQDKPFNNQCPEVNGQRSVTGCGATAISQIMYAHKYPERGVGSTTYTLANGQTVNATFDTVYDWENMLPSYNHGYTKEQADAVALLMFHVGVAGQMNYTPYASGSTYASMLNGLIEHFSYDVGISVLPKDFMPETDILTTISEELQIGHPVCMEGYTLNSEGHAFVCDGMQSNGFLHINWGWGGMADGYFPLSTLDPVYQGIGGSASASAFTEYVRAYVGVCPDKGGTPKTLMTTEKLIRLSADKIGRNDTVSHALDYCVCDGLNMVVGEIGYYIYDAADTVVSEVVYGSIAVPVYNGWYLLPIHGTIPTDLPDGKYTLEVAYRDTLGVVNPILVKYFGAMRMPMVVESDSITFEKMPIRTVEVDKTKKIERIDLKNLNQTHEWEIDLFSSMFREASSGGDDILVRMTINSGNPISVVGSYLLDSTNMGEVGSIRADVSCMVGYENNYYQYTPTDVHLTIAEAKKKEAIQVGYYIKVNGVELTDVITVNKPEWHIYTDEGCQDYSNEIVYDLVATLPASTALKKTQALEHTNFTKMSYFVEGIISNMRNTPEEIANYKSARFDISDDGTANNQYYCYGTKWLNNSNFTTGDEIAIGDKVVIYGQMKNAYDNQTQIKGYVYQHDKLSGLDDVVVNEMSGLYDIMGRKVEVLDGIPSGIYILRTSDNTTKIYINK